MRTRARISVVVFAIGVVMANGCTQASATPDSTASLQARLDALRSGQTITLDRTTLDHSGVLKIRVPGVTIDGNGSTLRATNDATSSVQVLASNVTVKNLRLLNSNSGRRYDSLDQQALLVRGTSGVSLTGISIEGSAAAGIFIDSSSNFTVTSPWVNKTRADGIHITGGSSSGKLITPTTTMTGDDGVAVVSYSDSPPCRDIEVVSPVVNGTSGGRGVSVVGGTRITYRNVAIRDTSAAGVYVATESGYNVQPVDTVSVLGGTVTRANVSRSVINGGVLVYGGRAGSYVTNVMVSDLTVTDTPSSAGRALGVLRDQGSMSRVMLARIAVRGAGVMPFGSNARGMYQTTGWTLNGSAYNVP